MIYSGAIAFNFNLALSQYASQCFSIDTATAIVGLSPNIVASFTDSNTGYWTSDFTILFDNKQYGGCCNNIAAGKPLSATGPGEITSPPAPQRALSCRQARYPWLAASKRYVYIVLVAVPLLLLGRYTLKALARPPLSAR